MHVKALIASGLAAALVVACAGVPARAGCESSADYGAVFSQADIDAAVKALPPHALGSLGGPVSRKLPRRVLLSFPPPVVQQGTAAEPGSPGTCEAQSFGYGLGSYTAARTPAGALRWNTSLPQNTVSAAWLYTLIQQRSGGQCPKGTRGIDYLEQLAGAGAPSRSQVPYQPDCAYLDGLNTGPRPNMGRFRIGSYAVVPVGGNDGAVAQIKSHIAAGQAVAFTGSVLCGYAQAPAFKWGTIYETATVPDSGHGQLLIGYDDGMGMPGKRGAFLVQNSFGLGWPPADARSAAPPGKAYWSYGSFGATQALAAVAYPVVPAAGGSSLRPSSATAALASVGRGYQWSPGGDDNSAYLILTHAFAAPVRLIDVTLTEPGGAQLQVTAAYGQHIASGYSYLKRSDGKAFLPGTYRVSLRTGEADEPVVIYTGKVSVKKLKRPKLPAASMQGVSVTGSTGAPVSFGSGG